MICLSAGSLSPKTGTDAKVTGIFFGGTTAGGAPGGVPGVTAGAGAGAAGVAAGVVVGVPAAPGAAGGGPSSSVSRPFQIVTALAAMSVAHARRLSGSLIGISVGLPSRVPRAGVPGGAVGDVGSTALRDWLRNLIRTVTVTPCRRARHVVRVRAATVALGCRLAGRIGLVVERLGRAGRGHRDALGDRTHDRGDNPVADGSLEGHHLLRREAVDVAPIAESPPAAGVAPS